MSERLTGVELDEAMDIAKSLRSLRLVAALAELKERRAADLSDADRETLAWAACEIRSLHWPHPTSDGTAAGRAVVALALLDRLTKAGR